MLTYSKQTKSVHEIIHTYSLEIDCILNTLSGPTRGNYLVTDITQMLHVCMGSGVTKK